jgi:rare lipoprotein A
MSVRFGARSRRFARFALLVAGAVALSACAETELLTHTVKRMSRSSESSATGTAPGGVYKVGKPYAIDGVWYYPKVDYAYDETGIASWYGPKFHGKYTADGEVFDQNALTAAHRTLPLPTIVRVTNLENGRSMKLRVNDRGPFAHGRIIDVSRRAAQLLGFERNGTARVRVQVVEGESRLIASRMQGGPDGQALDTPIVNEDAARKPGVVAQNLAPPPGGQSATGGPVIADREPVVVASRDSMIDAAPKPLDGRVAVGAAESTRLFVQVGAFTEYQNAYQVAARLKPVGNVSITSAIVDGKEFFRVRFGPLASVAQADRLLEGAIRYGYPDSRVVVD